MKLTIIAAVTAIGLTGGLGAASSASAAVFAVFNPVAGTTGAVANFSEDSMGDLTSTPTSAATVFNFELSPLAAFGNLAANFTFSAKESAVATVSGGAVQAPYSGTFTYTYAGPTTTMGGVTLTTGETLLSGTFANAVFNATVGSSAGGLTDDSITGAVAYTSGISGAVLPLTKGTQAFALDFLDISPVAALQNGFVQHFTAVGQGQFSTGLSGGGGGGVPEPATWAMMLTGVAGIGFCLRRRERLAPTAA